MNVPPGSLELNKLPIYKVKIYDIIPFRSFLALSDFTRYPLHKAGVKVYNNF